MIPPEAWAIAGIASGAWALFLLLVGGLAVRSGWRRASHEGRLDQVRKRVQQGRGGLAVFLAVWLLGNITAVFVGALVIASLMVS